MDIVCRPILLHNEFVPAIVGDREWGYQVLGHHDGMTVKAPQLLDNTNSFAEVFHTNAEIEGEKADYSTQSFFGFHFDKNKEAEFWEKDMPFVFVSFLQFMGRDIQAYYEYLESAHFLDAEKVRLKLAQEEEQVAVLAYYTMDANDIMLVIKCTKAHAGIEIIKDLHQSKNDKKVLEIRNSYSVLAINRAYIDDTNKRELVTGDIDLLELRLIERASGLADKLDRKLHDLYEQIDIDRRVVLGTEDEVFIVKQIPWKIFLTLYDEKNGVLCNSSKEAQQYTNAISAKLLHFRGDFAKDDSSSQEKKKNVRGQLFDYLYERVQAVFGKECRDNKLVEKKNFVTLINAFRNIEYARGNNPTYIDYNLLTLFFPLAVFMVLYEENQTEIQEYYDFIKRIKLCTQSFAKPNRVFSQDADFNIRYFDAPSKFLAIYNVFVYQMRELLNTNNDKQYEFLVCPGMNDKTEFREVYAWTDPHKHLFNVEIPEAQIYMTKLMFIMLGHEVSHIVGTELRNRKLRYEKLIFLSSRMVVKGLRDYFRYRSVFEDICFKDEKLWSNIENQLKETLEKLVKRYTNRAFYKKVYYHEDVFSEDEDTEVIDTQVKFYERYSEHTEIMEVALCHSLDEILTTQGLTLFQNVIWNSFNVALDNGKIMYGDKAQYIRKCEEEVLVCIESFKGRHGESKFSLILENGMEQILYLLEECYADMICILSLELTLEDYLYSFLATMDAAGDKMEKVEDTIMIARIALVSTAMHYDIRTNRQNNVKAENDFCWEHAQVSDIRDNKKISALNEKAQGFVKCYISGNGDASGNAEIPEMIDAILDKKILIGVLSYLLKCRECYCENITKDKKEGIQSIYKLGELEDIVLFFNNMTKKLTEYEEQIYIDIPKWIEKEKAKRNNEE